ncbi:IS66 family transposase [Candidatus Binatia bacterium]|nr:IS66 family transposase [Candidatus Binatia bacterium]
MSRGLLSQWNGAVADLLAPLAKAVHEQVLQSRWIQSDDTKVKVQEVERVYRNGHMWVYRGELGDVVYDFDWQRNKGSPSRMLAGYRGYLQADAAPAYDDIFVCNEQIVEVACWAHARRYFRNAELTAPDEAGPIVLWIRDRKEELAAHWQRSGSAAHGRAAYVGEHLQGARGQRLRVSARRDRAREHASSQPNCRVDAADLEAAAASAGIHSQAGWIGRCGPTSRYRRNRAERTHHRAVATAPTSPPAGGVRGRLRSSLTPPRTAARSAAMA